VDRLARVIDQGNRTKPLTISLFGDWGAGKSFLLEKLKQRLKPASEKTADAVQHRYALADFNAWQYEHTDNIRAGLAQEVVKGLIDSASGWERQHARLRYAWRYGQGEVLNLLWWIVAALASLLIIINFWPQDTLGDLRTLKDWLGVSAAPSVDGNIGRAVGKYRNSVGIVDDYSIGTRS